MTDTDKRLLAVVRPPKPISEMSEEELEAFAEELAARTVPQVEAAAEAEPR